MSVSKDRSHQPAGLAYYGRSGITRACEEAVITCLSGRAKIVRARILSRQTSHGLLLIDQFKDEVVILPGFASGYTGEGPSGFSKVLAMMGAHHVQIDEIDLPADQFERLEGSALTEADIDQFMTARAVRIGQYQDYVQQTDWLAAREGRLWAHYEPSVPLPVLASGLVDLALEFRERPSHALHLGYARLEDRLRELTGTTKSGSRLVEAAFSPKAARLRLKDRSDPGEQAGLEFLFRGVLQLHRNPHAHSELQRSPHDALSEFLVLNHLFRLLEIVDPVEEEADPEPEEGGTDGPG